MAEALIKKIQHFVRLSHQDKNMLAEVASERVRKLGSQKYIVQEGDRPESINVVLEGWGIRYKALEDGRRQILALVIPGDVCDLNIFVLREMDHSILSLTSIVVAEIAKQSFDRIADGYPRITRALWWDSLVTAAIQREWTINLGQRDALERMAHLFCEISIRMRAVGLATERHCPMPLTQTDLADATGMSNVHVNRTLQELRAMNLIKLDDGQLTILHQAKLAKLAMFRPNYLHLDREGADYDAKEEV